MGKSRFEGMEIAVREQAKIAESGSNDKVKIETLEAELAEIDKDIEQEIAEIKATPIDKDLLKKQAETELNAQLKKNDRDCKTIVMQAEQAIKQAEHDADRQYQQAKLDIEKKKANLINIKEASLETKERLDIVAKQSHDRMLSTIDNNEKTIALKIEKQRLDGQKRKRDIEIELRSLRARDKVIEEQKNGWKKFYNDTVEISKQPPSS